MKLYDYAASANCYKARLLLAQLERSYERIPIDIFGGDTLTEEYAAKNPARATPVLETDDGRFLPESNATCSTWRKGPRSCRPIRSRSPRSSGGCSSSRRT
jgi:glutathione S-transferase